ncbi:membrane protein insertion efficiency factor YidD [Aequorivita antarctica]|uniref:Membrane protein insertion efficiency factor YidD n=1 Tax=Aequorivita antarctica TaxID=153266 RepID=A0A5C6Z1A1_9FLAO|nr:membrane protein insertion efficiency factor YidD [Aequorivita antarctica]TXD73828.1 membrane protein insertion efficiency factor YidD [Aequorivita antarctica]SRX73458.1 Putative membrane protein insertion efficiency factor [Aequorivita antarctica]
MIKSILLLSIRSYWRLVPKKNRRKCLFKKSCSHYIYEQIKKKGLEAGLRAVHFRIENCNANYQIMKIDGEKILITKTNKVYPEKELSEFILKK